MPLTRTLLKGAIAMKIIAAVAVIAAASTIMLASPARSATASLWYWSPAACKSQLHNRGVQIGDGRTFSVAQPYCVGFHNHCWLSDGLRRYKVFIVVARSYDGVVRRFILTVTGRDTWTGSPPRIIEPYMSPAGFDIAYGPAAWSVAASENAAGCWDAHP
jgi:hypothetical protein